ncbi:MAG: hypothetical protein NVS3B20_03230 [Polyangiales bacterium]
MAIDTTASVEEFFQKSVEDACKNQRVEASPEAQTYVAALLGEFVRPDANAALSETLDRSLTLMLEEALQTPPPERFERLKSIGDGTLYVSGFFGEHLEARGVSDGFVHSIGGFAYRTAASMLRGAATGGQGGIDIYRELAKKFEVFVEVLAEVAETTSFGTQTSTGTLRLYEKWLRTGSGRVARELAAQGLSPSAKPGSA